MTKGGGGEGMSEIHGGAAAGDAERRRSNGGADGTINSDFTLSPLYQKRVKC